MKTMFLLITLLNIWKTFRILASTDGLPSANNEGNLLVEVVNKKNNKKGKGEALVMHGR